MRYLSLFSGIGSPEQALENLETEFELVGFSEIDKFAIKSYCAIHGVNENLNLGDITKIDIEKLSKDIDLITHGSPCQDFSIAGNGKGGDIGTNTRSSLMWNTVAICEHCQPKYVIWENVKNVLSKKHRHNFDKYLSEMNRIGFNNFYQVLNAKDYGVPQNRERIFVVSIRKDLEQNFEFPIGYDNGIRLKDILEDEVDAKYYINTEKAKELIENFISTGKKHLNINPSGKGMNGVVRNDEISATITTNKGEEPKIICPCTTPDILEKTQNGRRFKENNEPMFTLTSRDRHGILQIDIPQPVKVRKYNVDTNSLKEDECFIVRQATKKGYDIAYERDSINLEQPNSKIRRGRVGKQTINTLTTSCNQAMVQDYRIRKLTSKECWRLMGFKDEAFLKAEKVCSNSQLYKQAGNSIVVNVMEEIFNNLIVKN